MGANTNPIYSRIADVQWAAVLKTAAADYTGFSPFNTKVFEADAVNGGYIQRIKFKALGTNTASVARLFIGNGLSLQQPISMAGITPTATPATGNTNAYMATGTDNRAIVVAVGQGGDVSVVSTESAAVATTGPQAAILWAWTAPSGQSVAAYRIHAGIATTQQYGYFWAPTSSITASQSGTTLTVTAVIDCPDTRICPALSVGSVFATGVAAGVYIARQLTSAETNGSYGRTGTYTVSTSATVGSTTCTTDPLKYQQLIPAQQGSIAVAGVEQIVSYTGLTTLTNAVFIGEITLPGTTISAVAATADVEYSLNLPIPPGYTVYAGLGTTVAAGWQAGIIGGKY